MKYSANERVQPAATLTSDSVCEGREYEQQNDFKNQSIKGFWSKANNTVSLIMQLIIYINYVTFAA